VPKWHKQHSPYQSYYEERRNQLVKRWTGRSGFVSLRDRGIVLAVSSKNDDEIARPTFQKHPEMVLREDHIAVFQANWNDKASNIKAIAEELSLGLDAIVFLDDNPTERGLLRRLLPQVAVPELPEDPSLYARTLMAAGYFEAITFSAEDRDRGDFYRNNARRVALQKQAGDVDAYLASLEMAISFPPFDEVGRARITQLINKSNQFNLTTQCYTEAEVRDIGRDPDHYTLQVGLTDIYGNNGMISVVICRRNRDDWYIDTWLMSCRVLGRRVENAILREILEEGSRRGIHRIIGTYRPTLRNKMVEDHYAKLGFSMMEKGRRNSSLGTRCGPALLPKTYPWSSSVSGSAGRSGLVVWRHRLVRLRFAMMRSGSLPPSGARTQR